MCCASLVRRAWLGVVSPLQEKLLWRRCRSSACANQNLQRGSPPFERILASLSPVLSCHCLSPAIAISVCGGGKLFRIFVKMHCSNLHFLSKVHFKMGCSCLQNMGQRIRWGRWQGWCVRVCVCVCRCVRVCVRVCVCRMCLCAPAALQFCISTCVAILRFKIALQIMHFKIAFQIAKQNCISLNSFQMCVSNTHFDLYLETAFQHCISMLISYWGRAGIIQNKKLQVKLHCKFAFQTLMALATHTPLSTKTQ